MISSNKDIDDFLKNPNKIWARKFIPILEFLYGEELSEKVLGYVAAFNPTRIIVPKFGTILLAIQIGDVQISLDENNKVKKIEQFVSICCDDLLPD